MNLSPNPLPAQKLMQVISPNGGYQPLDIDASTAIDDFISHLKTIESKRAKKNYNDEHLIRGIFGKPRKLKKDSEKDAYCRYHLKVAIRELDKIVNQIKQNNTNGITVQSLEPWKEVLRDYIFGLNEIVPFLQRNDHGYQFFSGAQNSVPHSWEIFIFSKNLAFQSTIRQPAPIFNHREAQIGSIFILRQAMELRFQRLIGVYPINTNDKPPRLWHSFHQDFIENHSNYFVPNGFKLKDLYPVYEWCSGVVHTAYAPYVWQVSWAFELCGKLLGSHLAPSGSAWSIANGVEVIDVVSMQSDFEEYFLREYDHGKWCFIRTKPEALVRDWEAEMSSTSDSAKSVFARKSLCQKVLGVLQRICSKFN